MSDVKIPAVGESITSGLISTWHKKDGEQVAPGDVLLTLETDKVSTEITAEIAGTLKIKVPEGQEVKIGEVVATIEENATAPAKAKKAKPREVLPTQETKRVETPEKPSRQKESAVAPVSEETHAQPEPKTSMAEEGRITRKKLSPLRRKISAQLVMAQQTAAILTTFNECDMSGVMSLRARMQASFQKEHGIKLGFMSFFIKATVAALKGVPAINARMDGDDLVVNHYFDIGVAV